MSGTTLRLALLAALVALVAGITPVLAKSGDGEETEFVTYDILGLYKGQQKVRVSGGNTHARKELGKKVVRLRMEDAEVQVSDNNDDGYRDWRDIPEDEPVRVRAEFAKHRPKTNLPVLEVFASGRQPNCEGLAGAARFCPF